MKTYTKEFREKAVAGCRASALSTREFAEKIGVSVHTLKKWLYPRPSREPAKFVDLTAAGGEAPGAEPAPKPSPAKRIEIRINGATVAGDPAAIAEVIRGLGR